MSLSEFPKLTEAFMKLIRFMTWPRFVKTIATLLLFLTFYTMFENRQTIYDGIIANAGAQRTMIHAPISEPTKSSIQVVLDQSSVIVGVQLVSVDFKTNTRNTEYFKSNIHGFQRVFDEYVQGKLAPTPFFDDDIKNNERNTHLMNGEFVCYPITDIRVFQRYPHIPKFADTICSVSIPPYPGYFSGYITFYVKGVPTATEQQEIRAIARKLSIGAYDADITK